MDVYAAKVKEIRAYLADQLARTDHTYASDEDVIQHIGALLQEFAQCVNALPVEKRNVEKFQNAVIATWHRMYEYENLFVLSQTYAQIDGNDVYPFGFASLIEEFKDLVIAQQLVEISGAVDDRLLDPRVHAHARRVRLLCIYLLRRVQTDDARHLYGFARVAQLKQTIDLLLGPLPDVRTVDIETSAAADVDLMRLLVDAIRHISRVYLQRFSEDVINNMRSPRLGVRRAFFVNYTHLSAFKRSAGVSLMSDIEDGIRETRIDQETLSAYGEFLHMIELLKNDFRSYSQGVYFLNQPALTRLPNASRNARDAERRVLCDKFKELRADVAFVTRETNEGRVFYHEQLAREVERDLLTPIERVIEQLRCESN